MTIITQPTNAEELSVAEKRKAYMQAYRQANKERIRAKQQTNKERIKAQQKAYRQANKERIRAEQQANKEKNKAYAKAYYKANKEKLNARTKVYYEVNKEKCHAFTKAYQKARMQTDELYKTKCCMRNVVTGAFKRIQMNKPAGTETLLGCSWQEAKEHFEKLFEPGMTWMNHGEWHIDHIVPIATAQTVEDANKLNHITNLQPLWAIDNLTKGSRVAD